tara:strand:- start:185 stop:568 length:384 start_codon:yes stop_codon:yes gene_type:complete
MTSFTSGQFQEIKELLAQQQRDLMLANTQSTNSEVSGLHGEILDEVKEIKREISELKKTVDDHDVTIKTIPTFFDSVKGFMERAEPAVKTFEGMSWSGKAVVKSLVVIGIICAAFFGLKDLIHNFIK